MTFAHKRMKSIILIAIFTAALLAYSAMAGITSTFGNNNSSVVINGATNRLISSGTAGVSVTNNIGGGLAVTNQFGSPSSATPLTIPIIDHDYVGFTFSFTGSTNTTLQVFTSDDGSNTWNPTALFSYGGTGASTFYTNGYWDCHGVTHLGFQIVTVGTLDASNLLLEINGKDNKVLTKLAP